MPKRDDLKKVMVIGSGPIIIGQAAEFDYAGTQACKAIKEEGIEVVLVNSNPATIMTDENTADRVYIEPLNIESIEKIIAQERPDGIIPGLGGQTGLNMAVELSEAGILEKYAVELLGTNLEAIKKAEDRDEFKQMMTQINEPIPESGIFTDYSNALEFANKVGFPLIIRPAYTLGGTGGGIAHDEKEFQEIVNRGIKASRINQVLVEQSVFGWKEIEIEVMRDRKNNCIIVCSMENLDPLGIHTGDSIVFAPVQTLTDKDFQMLRTASLKIIRALEVEGGCNIQFGLDMYSGNYVVIEVNPRVSRSSALASKATGYPIAKIAAKIALGYSLDELTNPITGKTSACFEPSIDYVVCKIPRWPFDKFAEGDRKLGTQMKATGEVMGIERTIEGALLKSVESLDLKITGLTLKETGLWSEMKLENKLENADDERLYALSEALRRKYTIKELQQLTKINPFFLAKIKNIVDMEEKLRGNKLKYDLIIEAKRMGFSDKQIASIKGISEDAVRKERDNINLKPVYKIVDTCAGEFEAVTPYYYSTYETENELIKNDQKKVLVLGSGPIRIGQGIEFDYCSVHAVWALQEAGYQAVIVNNNPETVSTDFDTSDKLFFEPINFEKVMNIVEQLDIAGVVVQFAGQTGINLAEKLEYSGIKVLGTPVEMIDMAEDREKFEKMMKELGIPQTQGKTAKSVDEVEAIADELGFPLLVRPSYVLGGRAMQVVYDKEELIHYVQSAVDLSTEHPVLIDKYILGKEVEVDAIGDGEEILIPGIMEHIERAGVHSGDSMSAYPSYSISENVKNKIVDYTIRLGKALKISGIFNIQFVVADEEAYVLEVNPRASRTVPIMSKVTGVPMVKLATLAMVGKKLRDMGYQEGLFPEKPYFVVKAPVFSFEKLTQVETTLGPEMKSTGEVLGIDLNFEAALYKAFIGTGVRYPLSGKVMVALAKKDYEEGKEIVKDFLEMGYEVFCTEATGEFFTKEGLDVVVTEESLSMVENGQIDLIINTPTKSRNKLTRGFKMRRIAAETRTPCFTSLDTAKAFLKARVCEVDKTLVSTKTIQDYLKM
ncbi:MAG: carbamoyl-phosphate synthase large subunit [Eubacteriales bacterium]|nr:carbamoyl-phosphate synthase large subunit [Eubacteriales bacterium]